MGYGEISKDTNIACCNGGILGTVSLMRITTDDKLCASGRWVEIGRWNKVGVFSIRIDDMRVVVLL